MIEANWFLASVLAPLGVQYELQRRKAAATIGYELAALEVATQTTPERATARDIEQLPPCLQGIVAEVPEVYILKSTAPMRALATQFKHTCLGFLFPSRYLPQSTP